MAERTLRETFGIVTVRDLHDQRVNIHAVFSDITADFYLRSSLGIPSLPKNNEDTEDRKSIRCI